MPEMEVEFSGMRFKNSIADAAGPIASAPYTIKCCIEAGVGALVLKHVCLDPLAQLPPRPDNWFYYGIGDRCTLMNYYSGLLPLEKAVECVSASKDPAESEDARIVGGVFMVNPWSGLSPCEEISPPAEVALRVMITQLEEAGSDAIEGPAACPCPPVTPPPSSRVPFLWR
ncbi:MAG: hypothetical protein SWK76_05145 [Actinomycetota bacterium]|nr:hypothetical protein [Actinomycetota bacterium]